MCIINGAHLASATVPWHWLFFCPAPKFGAYFGWLVTKNLKAPKLILDLMGALVYYSIKNLVKVVPVIIPVAASAPLEDQRFLIFLVAFFN